MLKTKRLLFILILVVISVFFIGKNETDIIHAENIEYLTVSIHDPSIFQDPVSGIYYCYGSHITAAKSKDLKYWESFADGYSTSNKLFAHHYLKEFEDVYRWFGNNGKEGIWALDVIYSEEAAKAGQDPYFMYVTVVDGSGKTAISLATSSSPEGPFRNKGMIVCSDITKENVTSSNMLEVLGVKSFAKMPKELQSCYFAPKDSTTTARDWSHSRFPSCIDAAAFYDSDGNMYMLYGSFGNGFKGGLRTLKLDKVSGLRSKDNYSYSADGTSDPYYGKQIANYYGEGGFILPVKSELSSTGYYYFLYYSTGGLEALSCYNMRLFRSEHPDYGYVDAAGNSAMTTKVSGNRLGVRVMDNYMFSYMKYCSSSNGGNSALVNNEGKIFLTYHSKSNNGTEYHCIKTNQMLLNEDGWLVTTPFIYSGETLSEIPLDDVIGSYEFIYHRLATFKYHSYNPNEYYVKSTSITLNKDYTVSGAYKGTWSLDGNNISIKIDNQIYKGVILVATDEDTPRNQRVVFTGIGSDNRSIWGAKYEKTDKESVEYDSEHLEIGKSYILDFNLMNTGTFGSSIKWSSNNPAIKIDNGIAKVTRSKNKDEIVTLTAVVKKGKVSKTVKLKITVLGKKSK